MSKLEECAKIICAASGDDWQQGKAYHMGTAQAVLLELRKADRKMMRAMCGAMSPGKRPTPQRVSENAKHGILFRAAIDAALETK